MRILLNKRIIITSSYDEWFLLSQKLDPYIVVENKAYIQKMNLGLSVRDELKEYSLADITYLHNKTVTVELPIGLYDYIQHLLPKESIVDERRNYKPSLAYSEFKLLYKYQREAVNNMLPHNNGLLVAKPGSGKTIMGEVIGLKKGRSILWINDRIELAKQARKTMIEKLNVPEHLCGLLQGDNEDVKQYTFTTIQKLTKVLNRGFNDVSQKLIHFDTIIIDEAHHCVGSYNDYKQYFQVLNELSYNHVFGLTATPKRPDGNEHLVHAILGPIRYEVDSQTKTIPAKVTNYWCHIPTSKEVYESFLNMYTRKAMPSRVDDYLLFHEEYIKFCEPFVKQAIKNYNKVLIVSPRVAGAQFWSDYLSKENINHFLVYGAIKKRERLYTDKVLVATLDLVKEGFDVPDLEAILVLSRPINNLIKTQVIGRCERWLPNKKQPVVYFLLPNMKRDRQTAWQEVPLDDLR